MPLTFGRTIEWALPPPPSPPPPPITANKLERTGNTVHTVVLFYLYDLATAQLGVIPYILKGFIPFSPGCT